MRFDNQLNTFPFVCSLNLHPSIYISRHQDKLLPHINRHKDGSRLLAYLRQRSKPASGQICSAGRNHRRPVQMERGKQINCSEMVSFPPIKATHLPAGRDKQTHTWPEENRLQTQLLLWEKSLRYLKVFSEWVESILCTVGGDGY